MIARKPTKPRTLLMLDAALFVIVTIHVLAALTVNVIVAQGTHGYLMGHRVLGFTGVTLAVLVGTHLLLHLPWIKAQAQRALSQNATRRDSSR